jgi:small-conductance mechanosensitive channel
MDYIKKDETTLSVVKPVETKEETQDYKLEFLKKQELQILKDLNDYTAKRKEELAEVRTLIAEAEKLGIKETIDVEIEEEDAKLETKKQ